MPQAMVSVIMETGEAGSCPGLVRVACSHPRKEFCTQMGYFLSLPSHDSPETASGTPSPAKTL